MRFTDNDNLKLLYISRHLLIPLFKFYIYNYYLPGDIYNHHKLRLARRRTPDQETTTLMKIYKLSRRSRHGVSYCPEEKLSPLYGFQNQA